MPTITLYGPLRVPFVTKVRAALGLKKLEYRWALPQSPDDYARWSPRTGLLPALHIDGEIIEDSSRILDALDERFPEPPLLSADPKVARSQRRLEQWVEAALMFYWIHYLRDIAGGESTSPPRGMANEFTQRLDDLVNFLGDRPFFYSETPSRADFAVYSFLASVSDAVGQEVAREVESRAALGEYLRRVEQVTGIHPSDEPEAIST